MITIHNKLKTDQERISSPPPHLLNP